MPPQMGPSDASASPDRTDRRSYRTGFSRRTFIAVGGTTALASLAGCSAVIDIIADFALGDVNAFNGTDRAVSGAIDIEDPNGELVLKRTFDLEEEPENDETDPGEDNPGAVFYEAVWTDDGDYAVTVELEEDLASDSSEDDTDGGDAPSNDSGEANATGDEASEVDANGTDDETNADSSDAETDGNSTDSSGDAEGADDGPADGQSDGGPVDESGAGTSAAETVTIDDPDEQKLVIGIDEDEPPAFISFHVIEDFSDLEGEFE